MNSEAAKHLRRENLLKILRDEASLAAILVTLLMRILPS
jgi:hypothetical protein